MKITVDAMYAGTPKPLGPRAAPSAFVKAAIEGPWTITATALVGDVQGDPVNHGGHEKALHHYAFDHYATWVGETPELAPQLSTAPAFGENISTRGLTEADVCIGDVFRLGTAALQIAQGRQPCWKINARFGRTDMAVRVQKSGRTGWYYRVLEPGRIAPGDELTLADRPQPEWCLSRVTELLYHRTLALDELSRLSELPELAHGWQELARRRVQNRAVESWTSRLTGEA